MFYKGFDGFIVGYIVVDDKFILIGVVVGVECYICYDCDFWYGFFDGMCCVIREVFGVSGFGVI